MNPNPLDSTDPQSSDNSPLSETSQQFESPAFGSPDWKSGVSPILLTALSELARSAANGVGAQALLEELAQLTALVASFDGVGTMSYTATGLEFVHADNVRTQRVDLLQERLQQGPCLTSINTRQPVPVHDFTGAAARQQWPELAPEAVDAGLRSTLAVPLLAGGRAWGVLDVYREQPHHWTFADLLISKTLADVVASLLVLMPDPEDALGPNSGSARAAAQTRRKEIETDSGERVDRLQATLNGRLQRLNTRLNATRNPEDTEGEQ